MSRPIKLLKQTQVGASVFPAGAIVTVSEGFADDLVARGAASEAGLGTVIFPSGQSTLTVPHGLGKIPTAVLLTGSHGEVSAAVVTAKDAATFTITLPSNTTANRTIDRHVKP